MKIKTDKNLRDADFNFKCLYRKRRSKVNVNFYLKKLVKDKQIKPKV